MGRIMRRCRSSRGPGLDVEAAAALDEAFGALGEEEVWGPDLLRVRGDLLALQGDNLDAAEAAYREAILRAGATGALLFELRAATGLARLLQRRGRTGEAQALLAPVYARFKCAATAPGAGPRDRAGRRRPQARSRCRRRRGTRSGMASR